jgi:hypothetical protein
MRFVKKYWWAFLIIGAVLAYKFFSTSKLVVPPGGTPTVAASCAALNAYQKANPSFIPGMCS